jgi:hypothetical protein
MLIVLKELSKYCREDDTYDLGAFKIVYITPTKAPVAEMVGRFASRLAPYGAKVGELTGDSQMDKHQIAETQFIVAAPENWDGVTRKSTDKPASSGLSLSMRSICCTTGVGRCWRVSWRARSGGWSRPTNTSPRSLSHFTQPPGPHNFPSRRREEGSIPHRRIAQAAWIPTAVH